MKKSTGTTSCTEMERASRIQLRYRFQSRPRHCTTKSENPVTYPAREDPDASSSSFIGAFVAPEPKSPASAFGLDGLDPSMESRRSSSALPPTPPARC